MMPAGLPPSARRVTIDAAAVNGRGGGASESAGGPARLGAVGSGSSSARPEPTVAPPRGERPRTAARDLRGPPGPADWGRDVEEGEEEGGRSKWEGGAERSAAARRRPASVGVAGPGGSTPWDGTGEAGFLSAAAAAAMAALAVVGGQWRRRSEPVLHGLNWPARRRRRWWRREGGCDSTEPAGAGP